MASPDAKLAIIVGSGPGIGVGAASAFASHGFTKIALISRNKGRLEEDARSVKSSSSVSVAVSAYPADVADPEQLKHALEKIKADFGRPEMIIFNASKVRAGKLDDYSEIELVEEFKISNAGLLTTAKWGIPLLTSLAKEDQSARPSLFVTSGGIHQTPSPEHLGLSLVKSAQYNFTMNLAQLYEQSGVHIAAVVVNGVVDPADKELNPQRIGKEFWKLYEQDRANWTRETRIGC